MFIVVVIIIILFVWGIRERGKIFVSSLKFFIFFIIFSIWILILVSLRDIFICFMFSCFLFFVKFGIVSLVFCEVNFFFIRNFLFVRIRFLYFSRFKNFDCWVISLFEVFFLNVFEIKEMVLFGVILINILMVLWCL